MILPIQSSIHDDVGFRFYTMDTIYKLGFETLKQPSYRPDLALSYFQLFVQLKESFEKSSICLKHRRSGHV